MTTELLEREADVRIIDFSHTDDKPPPRFAKGGREKSVKPKQLRARARRQAQRGKVPRQEMEILYRPIEEWDNEELARGRPKASDGTFRGKAPNWVSREVYEAAMDRFRLIIREDLQNEAANAIAIVHRLINSNEIDEKGKPVVPASVKADLSKWLVEHIIGKPKQFVQNDISVKLQAVLAQAMFVPGQHMPELSAITAVIDAEETAEGVWDVEGEEDDD